MLALDHYLNLLFLLVLFNIAGSNAGSSPLFNIAASTPAPTRKTGADDFLNSENDKNDYDW